MLFSEGGSMIITIDPHSATPIFQQIHDRIVEAISRGDITPGQQLAPVRALALDFGINPATVKKAYDLLVSEGIITTSRREGSVVVENTTPHPDHLTQFQEELKTLLAKVYCQGIDENTILTQTHDILDAFTGIHPANSPESPFSTSERDL